MQACLRHPPTRVTALPAVPLASQLCVHAAALLAALHACLLVCCRLTGLLSAVLRPSHSLILKSVARKSFERRPWCGADCATILGFK